MPCSGVMRYTCLRAFSSHAAEGNGLNNPRRRMRRVGAVIARAPGPAVEIVPLQHHFIAQQRQPVAHAAHAEHLLQAGRIALPRGAARRPHRLVGRKPSTISWPSPVQHAIRLAHDGVGIRFELQRMRQQHRIDGGGLHRQLRQLGDHVHFEPEARECSGDHRLAPRAALRQQLARGAPAAQLQQLQAENVIQQPAQQLALGAPAAGDQAGMRASLLDRMSAWRL